MTAKLSQENKIIDLPDLNRFRIGDHVVVDASVDNDRFEGVIIGIELRRKYSSSHLEPCITLLHDGYVTDEFKPIDCRKVEAPAPTHNMVPDTLDHEADTIDGLRAEIARLRAIALDLQKGYIAATDLVERARAIISTSTYPNWHEAARAALTSTEGTSNAD